MNNSGKHRGKELFVACYWGDIYLSFDAVDETSFVLLAAATIGSRRITQPRFNEAHTRASRQVAVRNTTKPDQLKHPVPGPNPSWVDGFGGGGAIGELDLRDCPRSPRLNPSGRADVLVMSVTWKGEILFIFLY